MRCHFCGGTEFVKLDEGELKCSNCGLFLNFDQNEEENNDLD